LNEIAHQKKGSSFDEEIINQSVKGLPNINDPHEDIEFCWTKLDKKPKKLTWMVTSDNDYIKDKAKPDTVESV
jgi:hypothetical protein